MQRWSRSVRDAIDASPLYDGTLVSKDRSATIIAAELLDEELSAETYQAVLDLTRLLPVSQDIEVFVAGAGAITGYFSSYIDRDAGRLVPFTAIAVTVVLFCAFFTIRSAALPMFIAAATIVVTLGVMAASGVAFYAITNGMVVVLIGISVAEPMHLFGEYYALLRERPRERNAALVIAAMQNVWRPIALTSLTTVVGFLSLWATSTMPPIRYFGLFGALGVAVAWVLTVSWLPAAMTLLPAKPSRLMKQADADIADPVGRMVLKLGSLVTRGPRVVLLVSSVLCGVALAAAALVRVDHARIENFNESEPLYVADREINRTLAGTNHLDIVIEADAADGILEPATLRKIEGLQRYVQTLDGVGAVTSIVDYIKQLNRAVDGGGEASYVVPDDRNLIAQLMLTYQASAPPTEFQSLIDSANRTALVRVWLRADRWSEQRKVVLATRSFIEREFGNGPVTATLTGRVMLDYEWVQSVASGHAFSVLASTLSVLLMCIVIFRSFRDGLLCLAPLFVSVVLVYAVMGLFDIWLGVATSMFAAVAIGLGIDLAIHMVARARKAERMGLDTDAAIAYVYRSTGRAVLFNAAAVGLGFGILTLSAAPPIRMFGILVATAIVGAFVAALTVLPALLKVIGGRAAASAASRDGPPARRCGACRRDRDRDRLRISRDADAGGRRGCECRPHHAGPGCASRRGECRSHGPHQADRPQRRRPRAARACSAQERRRWPAHGHLLSRASEHSRHVVSGVRLQRAGCRQRSVAVSAGVAQGASHSGGRSRRLFPRHRSDVRRDPQRQSRDAGGLDVSPDRHGRGRRRGLARSSKARRPASRSRVSWVTRERAGAWTGRYSSPAASSTGIAAAICSRRSPIASRS